MIALRVPVRMSPEAAEKLMLYGVQIAKELERIVGQPVLYAMTLAFDAHGGLVMHRISNTDIARARQMFELASTTPVEESTLQKMHEH